MKRLLIYLLTVGSISGLMAIAYYVRLGNLEEKKQSYINKTFDYVLHNSEKNDLLVVGSSRVWVHVDPQAIGKKTGLKTYNLACDGSGLPEHNAMIRAYLQHHPAPQYILLNLDFLCFDVFHEAYNFPEYIPYLKDSLIASCLSPYNPKYRSNTRKNLYFLKWLSSAADEDKVSALFDPAYFDSDFYPGYKGYLPVDRQWDKEADEKLKTVKKAVFPAQGLKLFNDLVGFCRKNNIQLIGIIAPVYRDYKKVVVNADWFWKQLSAQCRKQKVPLWDFSKILYDQRKYYYNSTHLNTPGARIYTDSIVARINRLTGR